MNTYLVSGSKRSSFDEKLLADLPSPDEIPKAGADIAMRVGVENEFGEIYRIIEIDNVIAKKHLLDRLTHAGFWIDPLAPSTPDSLHDIIKYGDRLTQ
ncbi:hypothetical protein [Noviherbaspirillum sp.]|uniref:hypothetical protein n=1 Tax=Noviherbaspirillum sp. TaxID=1926288 RepID=UPI002FE0F03E